MKNRRILNWFEDGKIREALVGEGPYFLPDYTNRTDHGRSLVFRQLKQWADNGEKQQAAANGVFEAVNTLNERADLFGLLDVLLVVTIASDDAPVPNLPLRLEEILDIVANSIQTNSREISGNEDLRYFVINMIDRLPGLQERLAVPGIGGTRSGAEE